MVAGDNFFSSNNCSISRQRHDQSFNIPLNWWLCLWPIEVFRVFQRTRREHWQSRSNWHWCASCFPARLVFSHLSACLMRLYYTETRYIYFLSTNKCTRKGPIIPKWNTRRLKWMCCNTGSISKLSIARRAKFMGFCKSRLKTVRGGQILKPWRGKGSWNQIRFVSNPTNDFTRNGRRMLMTYRELGGRQLSLP